MEKVKKIKLYLGLFYLILLAVLFYFLFSNFSIQEITSYEFIKKNMNYFFQLKESNLFLLSSIFVLIVIIWILALGFLSPLGLFAGFVFGKWFGIILLIFGTSIGATLLYVFANLFLKDFIRDKFLSRFKKLEIKFRKNEFLYLLIFRFIGGIPFNLQNLLPCIFNVKPFNFFWATFFGIVPQLFLICSLGAGLDKVIDQNLEPPSIKDLVTTPDIYIPLIVFVCLVTITIFLRKLFYK